MRGSRQSSALQSHVLNKTFWSTMLLLTILARACGQTIDDIVPALDKEGGTAVCGFNGTATPYGWKIFQPIGPAEYHLTQSGNYFALRNAVMGCAVPEEQWYLYGGCDMTFGPNAQLTTIGMRFTDPRDGEGNLQAMTEFLKKSLEQNQYGVSEQVDFEDIIDEKTGKPKGIRLANKPGTNQIWVMNEIAHSIEANIGGANTEHLCVLAKVICDYRTCVNNYYSEYPRLDEFDSNGQLRLGMSFIDPLDGQCTLQELKTFLTSKVLNKPGIKEHISMQRVYDDQTRSLTEFKFSVKSGSDQLEVMAKIVERMMSKIKDVNQSCVCTLAGAINKFKVFAGDLLKQSNGEGEEFYPNMPGFSASASRRM